MFRIVSVVLAVLPRIQVAMVGVLLFAWWWDLGGCGGGRWCGLHFLVFCFLYDVLHVVFVCVWENMYMGNYICICICIYSSSPWGSLSQSILAVNITSNYNARQIVAMKATIDK